MKTIGNSLPLLWWIVETLIASGISNPSWISISKFLRDWIYWMNSDNFPLRFCVSKSFARFWSSSRILRFFFVSGLSSLVRLWYKSVTFIKISWTVWLMVLCCCNSAKFLSNLLISSNSSFWSISNSVSLVIAS